MPKLALAALREAFTAQARRLAEVEAAYQHVKDCLHRSEERTSAAEVRVADVEDAGWKVATRCLQAEGRATRLGRKLQRLGLHLAETRKKLRNVEGEREELRERCEKLESVRKAALAYRKSEGGNGFTHWMQRVANTRELDAALAATEVPNA
jgi:chromosome segregation ATPase